MFPVHREKIIIAQQRGQTRYNTDTVDLNMDEQQDFDQFLHWLDPNRERAGERYERIRRKLITIYAAKGVDSPEDLTDRCIKRVIEKKPWAIAEGVTPEFYTLSVARFIYLEWLRERPHLVQLDDRPIPELQQSDVEEHYACLERCLGKLTDRNRMLVLEYYRYNKMAKITRRADLARELGIGPNALRLRAHRIRKELEECIRQCIANSEQIN
jgi:DNA-directed RNA polymerase specialized sigma24 family protein